MIFYYSGCGNSKWLASELASGLGEELAFIPDLVRNKFDRYCPQKNESIGFVFPIYAWAAPKLVEDFVLSVRWIGKPSYVWFACTCGDEVGLTGKSFAQTLKKNYLDLDAAFSFQMPETYLCFPGFHLDSPEKAKAKIDAAKARIPSVISLLESRARVIDLAVGSFPNIKSRILRAGFIANVTDSKYFVLDSCVGCGKCEKVCPLQNINMVDGKPKWNGNCTQCMACYHHCPQNAIQFSKFTAGKGQYLYPEK